MSRTETALLQLHAALVAAAAPSGPDPLRIPVATKNEDIATAWETITAAGAEIRTSLNLRDGTTQILNEGLGAGGFYEIEQRTELDWIVYEVDAAKRDAAFDAGVIAVCEMIEALAPDPDGVPALPLHAEGEDEAYAYVRLISVDRSGLVLDGVPQIKACVMVIGLTFDSRFPI